MKQVVAFNQGISAGLTTRKAGAAVTRLFVQGIGQGEPGILVLNIPKLSHSWQLLQSCNLWVGFWMLQEIKVCYLTFQASQTVGRKERFQFGAIYGDMTHVSPVDGGGINGPILELSLYIGGDYGPSHRISSIGIGDWCFWFVFLCVMTIAQWSWAVGLERVCRCSCFGASKTINPSSLKRTSSPFHFLLSLQHKIDFLNKTYL